MASVSDNCTGALVSWSFIVPCLTPYLVLLNTDKQNLVSQEEILKQLEDSNDKVRG